MHAQLLHQLALAVDAVQIADQQNAQQQFRVDRRPSAVAVGVLQLGAYELEAHVAIDEAQQVIFGNVVFKAEVVEQRLGTGVLSHHEQQASDDGDQAQHQ